MTARALLRAATGAALLLLFSPDVSEATQVEIKRVFCSGSPCPQPMELPADFPTRINLRGTRLGRLSSGVTVQPTGWPDGTVTVKLGRTSSDGSRRVVWLTSSGSSAPSLSRLQLQFLTTTGQTVTAMADGAPFEIEALPPNLPDVGICEEWSVLEVTSKEPTADGTEVFAITLPYDAAIGGPSTTFLFRACFENKPETSLASATFDYRCTLTGGASPVYSSGSRSLSVGERAFAEFNVSGLAAGDHSVSCVVDPDNRVRESDEDNNTLTWSQIRVLESTDLVIEDVSLMGSDARAPTGFLVHILNKGPGVFWISNANRGVHVAGVCNEGTEGQLPLFVTWPRITSHPWNGEFLAPGQKVDVEVPLSDPSFRFPQGPNSCRFRHNFNWHDENDANNDFTLKFSIPGGN